MRRSMYTLAISSLVVTVLVVAHVGHAGPDTPVRSPTGLVVVLGMVAVGILMMVQAGDYSHSQVVHPCQPPTSSINGQRWRCPVCRARWTCWLLPDAGSAPPRVEWLRARRWPRG